jgi:hypothetical protein
MSANDENAPTVQIKVKMKIYREWAMPNKHTFLIKPIKDLIEKYIGDGKNWIDPFAGENSPAEITNDINPNKPTNFHLHAYDFVKRLDGYYSGCLFDPPYSLRQVKECYDMLGIELMSQKETQYFPTYIKDEIKPKIKMGGIVICCGWDTNAFGAERGFEFEEILLVAHGGRHNDTIVTVEKKVREQSVLQF